MHPNLTRDVLMTPNDPAHRPPSPGLSKFQNSKASVPSPNGGSVQRSGSAIQGSSLKNLRPKNVRVVSDAAIVEHNDESHEPHEKKSKKSVHRPPTEPQNSLCLGGENNHRVTESTEKTQTCRSPPNELTDRH